MVMMRSDITLPDVYVNRYFMKLPRLCHAHQLSEIIPPNRQVSFERFCVLDHVLVSYFSRAMLPRGVKQQDINPLSETDVTRNLKRKQLSLPIFSCQRPC